MKQYYSCATSYFKEEENHKKTSGEINEFNVPGLRTYEIKPQSRNQGQECIPQTLFVVLPNYFKALEKCCRIRRLLNSDIANSILPHTLLSLAIYAGTWWPLLCRIVLIEHKKKHKSNKIVSSSPQMLTNPGWIRCKGFLKMTAPLDQKTPFVMSTCIRPLYTGSEKGLSRPPHLPQPQWPFRYHTPRDHLRLWSSIPRIPQELPYQFGKNTHSKCPCHQQCETCPVTRLLYQWEREA